MAELTLSRKRPFPFAAEETITEDYHTTPDMARKSKQTRPTPRSSATLQPANAKTTQRILPTPPITPPIAHQPTRSLKLMIPKKETSLHEQRVLQGRKKAAERWEPKLQDKFPTRTEIRRAYGLKLLRHYSSSSEKPAEPNFVKPKIEKSERVTRLIAEFPLPQEQPAASHLGTRTYTPAEVEQFNEDKAWLRANKRAIKSDTVTRMGWETFSKPWELREIYAPMMESSLPPEDLNKEDMGQVNDLPEWRKYRTGRFAPP